MKKLRKLEINSEKIMKNEELISLKGGTNCWCLKENRICGITGTTGSASACQEICEHQGCPDFSWTGCETDP